MIFSIAFVIIKQYNHDYKGVNMRKKLNLVICIMIAVCIFIFATACQPKDPDGLIKLSTPKNLSLNGGTLSWDEVKNAKVYYILVEGKQLEKTATTTTFDLGSAVEGYGNFSVAVKAYGDGEKYGASDVSQPIVYHKGNALNTPQVTIEDGVARWQAVEFAANYSIKVTDSDNKLLDEQVSQDLYYDFTKKGADDEDGLYSKYGAYKIAVTANPAEDNEKYSPSLAGFATYYNSVTLSVPKFSYMTSTTLRWDTVSNATNYTVRKTFEDGTYEENTTTGTSYSYRTKFDLEKVGKYYFSVRANGDNQVYYTSEFSAQDEEYSITKIAPLNADDIILKYDRASANLSWKIAADSLATQITLDFSAMLPDGTVKLENSVLKQTISNTVKFVSGDVYDYYEYSGESVVKGEGMLVVYNMGGYVKIRYDSKDYFLKDKSDKDVLWKDYKSGSSIDIVCDKSNADAIKFVHDAQQLNDSSTGDLLVQNTNEKKDVFGSDGRQLYYFEDVDGESKIEIQKTLEYDADGKVTYHTFKLCLDDVFFKEVENEEDGKGYEYNFSDQYYGLIYDVSLSADRDSKNYLASESAAPVGKYLSYKIPEKNEAGAFVVNNAGEYAYIVINSYLKEGNTDKFSIEDDINFNGYEIVQIDTFKGFIEGNNHTVSGIVVGNRVMTSDGVVERANKENIQYSMFVDIEGDLNTVTYGVVQNVFYVGIGYVGYDTEELDSEIKSIAVAPIAINNGGVIRNVLVQSDEISAEGADVAGMVVNNYGYINTASVYANLKGRNVGGVAVNNYESTLIAGVGFYGEITSSLGEILTDGVKQIGGAGFAVNNEGSILDSFAIGNVSVTATGLDNIYAGGFVAINSGAIERSYSGEFTLNNVYTKVSANGDNAYAGGFVGRNDSGSIKWCYSTNKVTASLYAGGFVGFNNAAILGSYSTGGTDRTGTHRGAFAATSNGTITNSICYSTDDWAKDEYVEILNSSSQLGSILDVVNTDGENMFSNMRESNYRIPVLANMIYTKENTFTLRPSVVGVDVKGVAYKNADNGVVNAQIELYGNNTKKGNRVVVELKVDGVFSRYVYGKII